MSSCSSGGCAGLDLDGVQAAVLQCCAERGVDETVTIEQRHVRELAGHDGQIVMIERARSVLRLHDCVREPLAYERLDFCVSDHRLLFSLGRRSSLADN